MKDQLPYMTVPRVERRPDAALPLAFPERNHSFGGTEERESIVKRTIALLASVSLSALAPQIVHAGDVLSPPPLPQGYDVRALSGGLLEAEKDLKPLTTGHERFTGYSVAPVGGKGEATGIQWSGYVAAGAIYSNTRKK